MTVAARDTRMVRKRLGRCGCSGLTVTVRGLVESLLAGRMFAGVGHGAGSQLARSTMGIAGAPSPATSA